MLVHLHTCVSFTRLEEVKCDTNMHFWADRCVCYTLQHNTGLSSESKNLTCSSLSILIYIVFQTKVSIHKSPCIVSAQMIKFSSFVSCGQKDVSVRITMSKWGQSLLVLSGRMKVFQEFEVQLTFGHGFSTECSMFTEIFVLLYSLKSSLSFLLLYYISLCQKCWRASRAVGPPVFHTIDRALKRKENAKQSFDNKTNPFELKSTLAGQFALGALLNETRHSVIQWRIWFEPLSFDSIWFPKCFNNNYWTQNIGNLSHFCPHQRNGVNLISILFFAKLLIQNYTKTTEKTAQCF